MREDPHSAVDCRAATSTMVYFSLILFFIFEIGVFFFTGTRSVCVLPELRSWELQEGLSVGLAVAIAVFMCMFISVFLQHSGTSWQIWTTTCFNKRFSSTPRAKNGTDLRGKKVERPTDQIFLYIY